VRLFRVVVALLCLVGCRGRGVKVSEVRASGGAQQARITGGIYAGTSDWLWTGPQFAFRLDPPSIKPVYLELEFTIPDELMADAKGPGTLIARVNEVEAMRHSFDKPGPQLVSAQVPAEALRHLPVEVSVSTDLHFEADGKTKSLIFVSIGLKPYEQTAAFGKAQLEVAQTAYQEVLKQRDLKFPIERQKELMRLFHELPIWESLTFHGVRIIKNPLDLWMLQQIAWEVKPDYIVETGTWQGGSALWWAQTLDGAGLENSRVLTVDIQNLTAAASKQALWRKYVTFSLGSSTDPKIVAATLERVKGKRVIVNLDSDHSMPHVLEELKMYAPMVSKGSYILVEDTHLDGVPTHPEQGPGPMAAVRQFLKEGGSNDFEQDFSREALVMTSYPGGWLRRK